VRREAQAGPFIESSPIESEIETKGNGKEEGKKKKTEGGRGNGVQRLWATTAAGRGRNRKQIQAEGVARGDQL